MALNFLNNGYFAGKVAIGTETSYTVGGAAQVTIATGSAETALSFGPSNNDMFYMRSSGSQGNFQFQTSVNSGNSGSVQLQPFGGNVGIGTTSPNKKLEVKSSTTPLHLNRTGGATALIGLDINGTTRGLLGATTTAAFVSYSLAAAPLVTVANTGGIQFNTYSAGTLVTDASGNITVSSGGGAGGPFLPLAGGTMTGTNGVVFPDNFKLNLGTGSDLQIYHTGSHSFIQDVGTGMLAIDTNGTDVRITKTDSEFMAKFITDAEVQLYYNGSKKFETTNTGISIDVNSIIPSAGNSNAGYWLYGTHAHGFVSNANGDLRILALTPGGQKEVLRSYITTASKLIIDGDNYYNVGIGTTAPTAKLHVAGATRITSNISFSKWSLQPVEYIKLANLCYKSDTQTVLRQVKMI